MNIVRIVFLALLGLAGGWFAAWGLNNGYFEQWHRLPTPPLAIRELLPSVLGNPYVRLADNTVYSCHEQIQACWVAEMPSQEPQSAHTNLHPCDLATPKFTWTAHPPGAISDCIQERVGYGDGFGDFAFLLDQQGQIWAWSYGMSAHDEYRRNGMFPVLGMLFGLSIGSFLAFRRHQPGSRQLIAPNADIID